LASEIKIRQIETFVKNETEFFNKLVKDLNREVYVGDPILRRAIDKSLNDIILAIVDLSINFLRIKKRKIPKTYKEIILSTYEFIGDIAYIQNCSFNKM
jgi:uncharacterized protein YutE (UPF0331/DUF86 family)